MIADRWPQPRLLVGLLGAGALLVLAIPFVDGWVLDRVVDWDPGPRLDPLIATILLFGVPSLVLGMVSPVAVRLKAPSLEHLGRTAGRLFAVSTAGSIAGTFLTAFWLIPELGTDQVLASGAVALMLAAAAVALVERLAVALRSRWPLQVKRRRRRLARARVGRDGGGVAASELVAGVPASGLRDRIGDIEDSQTGYEILHTKDSQYHRIAVVEDDDSRYLRFDSSFQSGMYLDDPFRTRFGYTDYLQLPLAYRAQTNGFSMSGSAAARRPSGPGATSRACASTSSSSTPRSSTAYKYFALPRDPRLDVTVEDGRRFLSGDEGPWDVIVVDAFYSDAIPFHLATREFLELVRSRLPRRSRGREHHRRGQGPGLASLPLDASHLPRRLPDRYIHPVVDPAATTGVDQQHHPRGRRGRRAVEAVPARPLARRTPPLPRRARPEDGDPRPRRCADLDAGRPGADRRLRADRRPVAALRLGGLGGISLADISPNPRGSGSTTESRRGTTWRHPFDE